MKKAVIAMSGGVDSSVAALLMKNKGYNCVGATMQLYSEGDCSDAKAVAEKLSMPFYIFPLKEEFKAQVIDKFIEFYENGKTPNPCVECNRTLKFGAMMDKMHELNADFVVTGHYARVVRENGEYKLKKAIDESKDQSYFLYMLTQEQLAHIKFPLGEYSKPEIRQIAEENDLITARKKDSQDICFVPDGDYVSFIKNYNNKEYPKGQFIHKTGFSFGEHKGIVNYTIGQRKGLGIAYKNPLYVLNIDPETNNVILGDNEELFTDTVVAKNVNIISGKAITEPIRVLARVRYRHKEQPALAWQDENGYLYVKFDEPQRAITKGQSLVIFDCDTVLGGGEII
jgi:tRNA-specific 2-thiouridylase